MKFLLLVSLFTLITPTPTPPLRLIQTSTETPAVLLDEDGVFELIRRGVTFIDVTDGDLTSSAVDEYGVTPKKLTQGTLVDKILSRINESQKRMKEFLTVFSSFRTRYYKSPAGAQSQKWLLNHIKTIASSSNLTTTVSEFKHPWGQHSIIARIQGKTDEIVVVGAHQDSVNQWNPWFGRSPGADDDGSGTTTTVEAFRLLIENGYTPTRSLEFHWYSAEEGGLLGSQKVVAQYASSQKKVVGMFQVDMTGYVPPGKKEVIGIATDYTDSGINGVLKMVVERYCRIPWVETKCGYGCSDHASWSKAGYKSTFSFESLFEDHSPYIHTTEDTVEHIDFGHVGEFVKAVVGWGIEMCEGNGDVAVDEL